MLHHAWTRRDSGKAPHVLALAAAALALLAGGCAHQAGFTELADEADFDRQVLQSDRPAMVSFYKTGCPTCVMQESALESLAERYAGRVDFARLKIREATMTGANSAIRQRYDLFWVPTTILFVNGQEHKRWTFNHSASTIGTELEAVLARSGQPAPMSGAAPAAPGASATGPQSATQPAGCIEGLGCPLPPLPVRTPASLRQ